MTKEKREQEARLARVNAYGQGYLTGNCGDPESTCPHESGELRYAWLSGHARGIKEKQGMLYGVKADVWQALALAVTWPVENK